MKQEILSWLNSGCDSNTGIALLEKYGNNKLLVRLIKTNPSKNSVLLKNSLLQLSGIQQKNTENIKPANQSKQNFRTEFPFLNNPDCPIELKALVTDKFTSFYAYRQLHKKLFDCVSLEECAETAKALIENYTDNRSIWAELEHYRLHKRLLGKHPIFKHYKRINDLRKFSVKDLVLKQMDLKHNIWRIQSEIAKGDKPHLDAERLQRLEIKQSELSEVNRLLGE